MKPGRHDEAAGVELGVPALGDGTDRRDPSIGHGDVAHLCFASRAVAHESAADHQIGHGRLL